MPYSRIPDVFIHVFAALAFMLLPLLFMSGQAGVGVVALSIGYWVFCLTYIFIFYFNAYWLIPQLYLKKKYLFYVAIVLVSFLVIAYARPFELLLQHHRPRPHATPG
jgi:two-component system LytT family sensor kinase